MFNSSSMPLFQSGRPGATPGWRTKFCPRGSNRSGTRLLNGIDAGANPAGGSTIYAPHAEAVEATACKPVLTRCESGAALHFILSPRDVTDSMRGFEPRRQGATPSAETIPRVAQQKRHPAQTRISARANRAAGTI